MKDFKEELDKVDASIFSGNALHYQENIDILRCFLERWNRELCDVDLCNNNTREWEN